VAQYSVVMTNSVVIIVVANKYTMKIRLFKVLIMLFIVGIAYYSVGGIKSLLAGSTVRAFADLSVDFHVPANKPLFNYANMAPGTTITKTVDVTNTGTLGHVVAVRGVKKGGIGINPAIESVMSIVITDGVTSLYGSGSTTGAKTVQNFFSDSGGTNGIVLGYLVPSAHKAYTITASFPLSADNKYQGKSVIFDLLFGKAEANTIVINEVYYRVDSTHGLDSPKDQGNTKGNGQNNEWVELFNPTDQAISIKNWSLTDNSGQSSKINANISINAGAFGLLSKDASTWKYWNVPAKTQLVQMGNQIGDGLNNTGDRLILKNAQNQEVDRMSWGSDSTGFVPPGTKPMVPLGSATTRVYPGFDSNAASDWVTITPPTPGK
jgi:hypothetical protein